MTGWGRSAPKPPPSPRGRPERRQESPPINTTQDLRQAGVVTVVASAPTAISSIENTTNDEQKTDTPTDMPSVEVIDVDEETPDSGAPTGVPEKTGDDLPEKTTTDPYEVTQSQGEVKPTPETEVATSLPKPSEESEKEKVVEGPHPSTSTPAKAPYGKDWSI